MITIEKFYPPLSYFYTYFQNEDKTYNEGVYFLIYNIPLNNIQHSDIP